MENSILSTIADFCKKAYKDKDKFQYVVDAKSQEQEILRLKNGLREEDFFIIIDLLNMKIIDLGGWDELGYDERYFSLKNYFEISPSNGLLTLLYSLGKQLFLNTTTNLIGFLKPSYIINTPIKIKKNDDTLYLVKRTISPWQLTTTGIITAYLSYFTIIKDSYDHEGLEPRLIGIPEEIKEKVMKEFMTAINQLKASENKFSPKLTQILELYSDSAKSSQEIADELKITYQTLKKYNKAIIIKAKQMFGDNLPIKTAKDVALYLKKHGLFENKKS
jgi:hypothetical protein